MLTTISTLIPDDLVIVLCYLVGTALYLLAIVALCRCLFGLSEAPQGDGRLESATRRREDLRRALGRG
jgi:hypothetical protein